MGLAAAIGVGAVASIGGAMITSGAASDAAASAAQSAAANNALQKQIYQQNTANETPFMQSGLSAQTNLNGLLNGDSTAFNKFLGSTNYQFQLGQGLNAVNNNFATRGALNSGAALKAINNYAQGQAGNALSGYMSALQNQQGVGLSAANALAGVGTNYANAVSSNNNNAATAAGNASMASANALSSGLSGAAGLLSYGSSYGGGGGFSGGGSVPSWVSDSQPLFGSGTNFGAISPGAMYQLS